MATDANGVLQTSVTKVASFNSTGFDLKTGTPRRGLKARFVYSAAANASGANSVTFSVEHSDDNGTFYPLASGASDIINLTTTALSGEISIPFETSKRYVRAVATFAGAGGSPTITYQTDLAPGRPG
jgi:hypothetical protein